MLCLQIGTLSNERWLVFISLWTAHVLKVSLFALEKTRDATQTNPSLIHRQPRFKVLSCSVRMGRREPWE